MTKPTTPTPAISPSLADQPAIAPGAIPVGGTDTQEQALDVTHEQKVVIDAPGTTRRKQAERQALHVKPKAYDVTLQDGSQARLLPEDDLDTGTLGKIVDKFNGVPMTEIEIPRAMAWPSGAVTTPALGTARADIDHTPKPLGTAPADADHSGHPLAALESEWNLRIDDKGVCTGIGLPADPSNPTTRLKMTLQALSDIPGDADNPLTRCTFGAVYSPTQPRRTVCSASTHRSGS